MKICPGVKDVIFFKTYPCSIPHSIPFGKSMFLCIWVLRGSNGIMQFKKTLFRIIPIFRYSILHYSITPLFHCLFSSNKITRFNQLYKLCAVAFIIFTFSFPCKFYYIIITGITFKFGISEQHSKFSNCTCKH